MLTKGGWCDSDLDPRLFYRQLICVARGVKCKNTLAFRIRSTHGKWPLLGVEAKERNIYQKPDTILQVYEAGEEPALQCRRQFARRTRRH